MEPAEQVLGQLLKIVETEATPGLMAALVMEKVLSAPALDALADRSCSAQYTKKLLFSTCFELLFAVSCNTYPSLFSAVKFRKIPLHASLNALYGKVSRVEPSTCESLLSHVYSGCRTLLDPMKDVLFPSPLAGLEVRVWDGNHLPATQRRIRELRDVAAAPLPGFCLVMLDPQRGLLEELIAESDAHAGERTRLPEVATKSRKGVCNIFDRNFCVVSFLHTLESQQKLFLVRQHSQVECLEIDEEKQVADNDERTIWEQRVQIGAGEHAMIVRRIHIRVKEGTKRGEKDLYLLTNLPESFGAEAISAAYRWRWRIEVAFRWLESLFASEINTLSFPRAALFSFSVACCAFNVLSVVKAAIRGALGRPTAEQVSDYQLGLAMTRDFSPIVLAVAAALYQNFAQKPVYLLVDELYRLARLLQLRHFTKAKAPKKKKPPTQKTRFLDTPHVSTQRVLTQSRSAKSR